MIENVCVILVICDKLFNGSHMIILAQIRKIPHAYALEFLYLKQRVVFYIQYIPISNNSVECGFLVDQCTVGTLKQ